MEGSWGLLRALHSGNLLYHWLPSPKAWRKRGDLHNFEGSLLSSHRTDPGSYRASHLLPAPSLTLLMRSGCLSPADFLSPLSDGVR